MVTGPTPHAVLLVGPPSVGKTTLALDLAAGLLCGVPDPADRPCRDCRSCRMIAGGNHPDLHRLVPEGPGGQVVIGGPRDAAGPRGIRDLLRDLTYLPVEGAARVAIVEGAAQMNEDAQNALLKTLEEPGPGVTIVLCADQEELILPTVRSRCARIRLGPMGPRDIETILGELDLADPGGAARLGRIAAGRPGVAVAYALAPEALTIRDEIARTLIDLLGAGRARRLAAARELLGRAGELAQALAGPPSSVGPPTLARPGDGSESGGSTSGAEVEVEASGSVARVAPAERRRAARQLIAIWRDVARDLAVAALDGRRSVNDVGLIEDVDEAARAVPPGAAGAFLRRLDRVGELVAGNVGPELAIDVLALAWPATERTAA
ncbi:MAG: polymerase subunit delta [Chloroflexota bacterium]|nr:polymerase subunit delta [Chloroflexota bacterium]